MKKSLLIAAMAIFFTSFNSYSQEIKEPNFIGECVLIQPDNSTVVLEKHLTQSRTVNSTGLMLTGIGKRRTQLQIPGCCSPVTVDNNNEIQFIIKSDDNRTDPFSIIKIFQFEKKKKFRRAEVSSFSSLGSAKSNNFENVPFTGEQYGENSYLIKINANDIEPGEYGIIISNPNAIDGRQVVISAFSVNK
ncbi:hypothetical protein ACYSNM_08260 [Myroides sp. LJL116]